MTEKLNPEVMVRWVAALRSGEYQQTHYKLTDLRGGFCCLGLLSNLYAQQFGVKDLYELEHFGNAELPGDRVCAWAGLDVRNAKVVIQGVRRELWSHNDGAGSTPPRTFAEIADAIEAQL